MIRFLLFFVLLFPADAMAQSFEEALSTAYQNNPGIKARRAELRAMDENVAQALSFYRPDIQAVGGIGKSRQEIKDGGMFSGSGSLTPRDAGIKLTQPLFRGFRTQSAVSAAESRVHAARAALRAAEQSLMFETARAYLDLIEAKKIVALTRGNETVLREQLEATNNRFQVGEVTKTDVSQSIARLNGAIAERTRAEGDLSNRMATFVRLTGLAPGDLAPPKLPPLSTRTLPEALALAEKNNPSILAAHYGREAASADIDTAQGALLPEINLVGSVSRGWDQSLMLRERQDDATIMARVTIPLYRTGADYAKTRAAQNTTVQKRMELEEARRQAREQTERAWQSLETVRASLKAFESEKEANELALYGVQEESKVGTRTILDVLNARQELLGAKVNLAKAEHDEAIASLQIRLATGSLSPEEMGLSIPAYDPGLHYEKVRDKWLGFDESP